MGHAETHEGIKKFFAATPSSVSFAIHYITNPIIDVTGDTANGTWYLWQPMVMAAEKQAMWPAAHYHERYRREPERWRIEHLKLDIKRFC